MEYKTESVRPLSYYAQITYLSFHPMEKDESYKIHSVKVSQTVVWLVQKEANDC